MSAAIKFAMHQSNQHRAWIAVVQTHANSFTNTVHEAFEAWAWARANRNRRILARRAANLGSHLRNDLGLAQGVNLEIIPAPTASGGTTVGVVEDALSPHHLSVHDWPVTGTNDNVSWRPKRAWLALA